MCRVYLTKLVSYCVFEAYLSFSHIVLSRTIDYDDHHLFYPERKDKIEDRNKLLVQKFQSQLTQQLELLHKTVATSVTQQEQQLRDMEEDMQSFVLTKTKVRFD